MTNVAAALTTADELDGVLRQLSMCGARDQVEGVFGRYKIDRPEDKSALLTRCMGIEEVFYSPHEPVTEEDVYEYDVSVFLEGSWRFLVNE